MAFAVVAVAELLGRGVALVFVPGEDAGMWLRMIHTLVTNKYVLITGTSLAAATLFHRSLSRVNGPEELGGYLLYLFLFVIGLPADLKSVLFNVPLFFVFCAIIALTNLGVTLILGKLLHHHLEELLVCVNATLGGPPTAAAMAISKGWDKLVLPALLIGVWGYVIGTPLGVLMVEWLQRK